MLMIRKFNGNNFMKGQITQQLSQFVNDGVIQFEKGEKRNTCIIIVDESKIDTTNLKYMYKKLIPEEREVKEAKATNLTLFTKEDLLRFNEALLGRGMPVEVDGVGYNKADYGACSNYYNGLSDAQLADLAKRLVKYTETQLGVDKATMKETAEALAEQIGEYDRTDGISIDVRDTWTLISFRYNEEFVNIIKEQKRRQYEPKSKQWVVPNEDVVTVLRALEEAGADVANAIDYYKSVYQPPAIKPKTKVLVKYKDEKVLLKFDYNKEIVERVKSIEYKDRQWNPQHKFWSIEPRHLEVLQKDLENIANFKQI